MHGQTLHAQSSYCCLRLGTPRRVRCNTNLATLLIVSIPSLLSLLFPRSVSLAEKGTARSGDDIGAMAWLQYLKRLYSLDTLDTRFVIPANTPSRDAATELTIDPVKPGPSSDNARKRSNGHIKSSPSKDVHPSQWNTPEFYFYYLVFLVAVPYMFKTGYDVSKCTCFDLFRT